jgi:hypothetical protein
MKATTGSILLLIMIGGLIVYLGQKALAANNALPIPSGYSQENAMTNPGSPQPALNTPYEATLAQREADIAAAEGRLAEQSSELERQMGEVTRRQAELDSHQAGLETREAKLASGQSELAQEEQRLKDLQVDLDGKAADLDQRERVLNSDRIQLDRGKDALRKQQEETRILLWVLYGLIALTCTTLLVIVWLAYRLVLH